MNLCRNPSVILITARAYFPMFTFFFVFLSAHPEYLIAGSPPIIISGTLIGGEPAIIRFYAVDLSYFAC